MTLLSGRPSPPGTKLLGSVVRDSVPTWLQLKMGLKGSVKALCTFREPAPRGCRAAGEHAAFLLGPCSSSRQGGPRRSRGLVCLQSAFPEHELSKQEAGVAHRSPEAMSVLCLPPRVSGQS